MSNLEVENLLLKHYVKTLIVIMGPNTEAANKKMLELIFNPLTLIDLAKLGDISEQEINSFFKKIADTIILTERGKALIRDMKEYHSSIIQIPIKYPFLYELFDLPVNATL